MATSHATTEMDSSKLNVQCTYPHCTKWFETEKIMKNHKKYDASHDYCKKCDVDCADWEDLIQHKIAAMAPFLEGRMKRNPEAAPKHIVCEFCGMDFKSFGGRTLHRKQMHPAEQNIECPGCQGIFISASSLIAHFEDGHCDVITRQEYIGNVNHKFALREIMQDPEAFTLALQANNEQHPGLMDDEDGGVSLLDCEDEGQKGGYKPLKAERDLMVKMPLTRANLERWPRLPGQTPSQLTDPMRSMSITSHNDGTEISASSEITSRRGDNKIHTETYPSINTTPSATTAWTTGQTPRALFNNPPPTPAPGDWQGILAHRAATNQPTNLLHTRICDPSSPTYTPHLFHSPTTKQYHCPFPHCSPTEFPHAADLSAHFEQTHTRTQWRCPLCSRLFAKGSALIAHAEAEAGKCRVREVAGFRGWVDEWSGGFLDVEAVRQGGVIREGVMSVRFFGRGARK